MTDIEKYLEDNKEFINRMEILSNIQIPSVICSSEVEYEVKLTTFYNDFIFNFLINKKNNTGKIDDLILHMNFDNKLSLKVFLEKQTLIKYGYAILISKNDKYVKIKLTQEGLSHFKIIGRKYKINEQKIIYKASLYALKLIRKSTSFFFKSTFDNKIKRFIESGIIKMLVVIIGILTFIIMIYLNWDKLKNIFN